MWVLATESSWASRRAEMSVEAMVSQSEAQMVAVWGLGSGTRWAWAWEKQWVFVSWSMGGR